MKRLLLKNGHVIDPASGVDGTFDVLIANGRVESVTPSGENAPGGEDLEVVDASDKLVLPGLVDVHTHLREPGYEYKETIETGGMAAVRGGVTSIACMANTSPVNDNSSVTRFILKRAESSPARVHPVGAVSVGLAGKALTEMGDLKEAGCVAVSDDGAPVTDAGLMRRALEYSGTFDLPVITHAEDKRLAAGGSMNEGEVSTRLGLTGIPNSAEDSMVARDIALAELTGGRLHVAHVSTSGAVELVRKAKERGVNVTAEATPHHLTLTEEAVMGYNTNAKMNPPLRTWKDVEALREGLMDGTIDCIATDHAPHATVEKDVEFDKAAFGIVGLETALSIAYGLVVYDGLSLERMLSALTSDPARCLGLEAGTLKAGAKADVTLFDPEASWTVDPSKFASKGRNTPYAGLEMKGTVEMTIVGGDVVYRREKG